MKILVAHTYYQQRGGEDAIFEQECALLRDSGHEVRTYTRHNDELRAPGSPRALSLARDTLHSRTTSRQLEELIAGWRPHVAHVHNIHPLISPSIYSTLHNAGVPIVQSIHNYRWFCIGGTFFRNGRVCEDCFRKPWGRLHGLVHRCYRQSFGPSAVLSLTQQRASGPRKLFGRSIRLILVNTEFIRTLFVEAGYPKSQLALHPNFLARPSVTPSTRRGGPVLFAGRLDVPKGVDTLVRAAALLPGKKFELVGDGPQRGALEALARELGATNVHFAGSLPAEDCRARMAVASISVVPSIWYESFPMVLLENFGAGTPVVASRIGSLATIIRDGENGLVFEPGNATDLARQLARLDADPGLGIRLATQAWEDLATHYSPEAALSRLQRLYEEAIR